MLLHSRLRGCVYIVTSVQHCDIDNWSGLTCGACYGDDERSGVSEEQAWNV